MKGFYITFPFISYQRKMREKKIVFWILVIVAIIVLLNYVQDNYSFNFRFFNDTGCPDNIIPKSVFFEIDFQGISHEELKMSDGFYSGFIGPNIHYNTSKFNDGVPIRLYAHKLGSITETIEDGFDLLLYKSPCHKGASEGENLNYYYCENLAYYKENQEISEEGVIGKKTKEEYRVRMTLKEIGPRQIIEKRIVEYQEFEVIDATCKKEGF